MIIIEWAERIVRVQSIDQEPALIFVDFGPELGLTHGIFNKSTRLDAADKFVVSGLLSGEIHRG